MNEDVTFLSSWVDSVFERYGDVGFDRLTPGEQTFVCVWCLIGEVDNGGFDQFFYNSSGDHALVTPRAIRRIGATGTAELVEEALRHFPSGAPSPDRNTRIVQLDALPNEARVNFADLESRLGALSMTSINYWLALFEVTRASFLQKGPNKSPEPTPTAVTPRATDSKSE